MTANQRRVLAFVADYLGRNRYAPRVEDVAEHMGWTSKSTAHFVIRELHDLGLLDSERGDARTLHVTDQGLMVLTD